MTTPERSVEELAEQLHVWYLEATEQDNAEYNYQAVVPYADLSEGQKAIDRYIASKPSKPNARSGRRWWKKS